MINHRNELDFLTIMVNLLLKEKIINLSLVIMTDKSQLKVKQFYLLLIKKTLLSFVIILSLAACDNSTYNELFRNPYIVEVVEANSINADKWYEFATKAEAYNKNNEIHISFDGSEPEKMTFQTVDFHAETNPFGTPEYISTAFPEDKIIFDVKAMDIDDILFLNMIKVHL